MMNLMFYKLIQLLKYYQLEKYDKKIIYGIEIRKIKEVNPGFYCFNFDFLERNISKIKKSQLSKEYYLTDLIAIANEQRKKVVGLRIPFKGVGIGINRYSELEESQRQARSAAFFAGQYQRRH